MDEKTFSAEFRARGLSELKHVMVEGLMPIFRRLASDFRVNIIVECRNGFPCDIREDVRDPEKIYFHLDTHPQRYNPSKTVTASSLFGLIPSESLSLKEYVPSQKTPSYHLRKTLLYSPENHPVGIILGSNIVIYEDVLTSGAWSDQNRIKLLEAMAYWFLPRMLINTSPHYEEGVAVQLKALRAKYRQNLLLDEQKAEFRRKFKFFVDYLGSETLGGFEEKLNELEKELEKHTAEYFEMITKVVNRRRQLEVIRNDISVRDFEKEFEAIMIMESIETIRVENGVLVIKTGPITQIPEADYMSKGLNSFDIGEFVIRMDTKAPNFNHLIINFHQDTYPGPYRHIHIDAPASSVCFGGNTDGGLNTHIDNLMSTFDTVPLIHLILTFLKKEMGKPRNRDGFDRSLKPQKDEYKSEEERNEQKRNFVQLASDTMLRFSSSKIEKEIEELIVKIDKTHDDIMKINRLLRSYRGLVERLGLVLNNEEERSKGADRLLADESIFSMVFLEDEFMIYFSFPVAMSPDDKNFSQSYILKINTQSTLRLLAQTVKKSFQNIPLIDPLKMKLGDVAVSDEAIIVNLQNGNIFEILELAKKRIISHIFSNEVNVLEIKESENEQ